MKKKKQVIEVDFFLFYINIVLNYIVQWFQFISTFSVTLKVSH